MVALVDFDCVADGLRGEGEPLSEDQPGDLAPDLELAGVDDARPIGLVEVAGGVVADMDPLRALERPHDLGKGQASHQGSPQVDDTYNYSIIICICQYIVQGARLYE